MNTAQLIVQFLFKISCYLCPTTVPCVEEENAFTSGETETTAMRLFSLSIRAPILNEMILFLKENKDLWGVEDVHQANLNRLSANNKNLRVEKKLANTRR